MSIKTLNKYFQKNRPDIFAILGLLLFSPIFFLNLSGSSLIDFDEAWYAEIARNIIVRHQPFLLFFNEQPYTDHPPFGFIVMSLSFLIFGISEFSARLPSALAGFGSVIILYLVGKNLFNRTVGIGAALILTSSIWFIVRSRSANLDSPFLLLYLLSFYCAIQTKNNGKWIYGFAISLALLLLTKSVLGISILIPSAFFLLPLLKTNKLPKASVLKSVILFLLIIFPWFLASFNTYGLGYFKHIIDVGFRTGSRMQPNLFEITKSLTVQYLHFGIKEWFYPAIIAIFGSLPFIIKKPVTLLALYAWLIILLLGFLTSTKTEIWHLIPLYPIIGLLIAYFLFELVTTLAKGIQILPNTRVIKWLKKNNTLNKTIAPTIIILLLVMCLKQIYESKLDIKLTGENINGLSYIASQAKRYNEKIFLDNEFFLPGAVFYSQRNVYHLKSQEFSKNGLKGFIEYGEKPALVLTEKYRLTLDNIDQNKYEILSEHKGHVLIKVPKQENKEELH